MTMKEMVFASFCRPAQVDASRRGAGPVLGGSQSAPLGAENA